MWDAAAFAVAGIRLWVQGGGFRLRNQGSGGFVRCGSRIACDAAVGFSGAFKVPDQGCHALLAVPQQ